MALHNGTWDDVTHTWVTSLLSFYNHAYTVYGAMLVRISMVHLLNPAPFAICHLPAILKMTVLESASTRAVKRLLTYAHMLHISTHSVHTIAHTPTHTHSHGSYTP